MSLGDPLTISVLCNIVLAVALGMLGVHHYHTTNKGDEL